MTVDTYSMLAANQDLIDAANKTIVETQKTEKTLQEHILITDTKIGTHNVHEESHPDIRHLLSELPSFITDPEITGPDAVEKGDTASWTISAISMVPTVQVTDFTVIDNDGVSHPLEASPLGTAVFTTVVEGEKNEQQQFTVQARGTYNYVSKVAAHEHIVTLQVPPTFDEMTHNIPTVLNAGSSYNININGIIDLDGDLASITLTANNGEVNFPAGNLVTQGTPIPIQVTEGLVGTGTVTFTITATDSGNRSNTYTTVASINSPPDITNIVCTLDQLMNNDSYIEGGVYNVTDDFSDVTCTALCSNANITITPDTFNVGDTIRITASNGITANTSFAIEFTFTDEDEGVSTYDHIIKINNPPVVTGMTCTLPTYIAPGKTYDFTVSGATDPDGGDITYEIDVLNLPEGITLSKTVGITAGETLTLTTSDTLERLVDAQQLRFRAIDNRNKSTNWNFSYRINQIFTVGMLSHNIPQLVKPSQVINLKVTSPVTHPMGTAYTYSFQAEDTAKLIISDVPVTANVNAPLTIGTSDVFERGTTSELTLTINDGVEEHALAFTLTQNNLPVVDTIACSLGTTRNMYGGPENAIKFSLSGGSDVESGFTYSLDVTSLTTQGATVSKSTGITAGEQITLTAPKKTADSIMYIDVWATDTMGERSAVSKRACTVTIEPIIVLAVPSITYPANNNYSVPYYGGFTMTWSAATKTAWTGNGSYPNNV